MARTTQEPLDVITAWNHMYFLCGSNIKQSLQLIQTRLLCPSICPSEKTTRLLFTLKRTNDSLAHCARLKLRKKSGNDLEEFLEMI